ncbi:MAG: two-component system, sensor histidine kinase and response regulator [Bacteroidota bacterium]|nr:two-component system, sensor histidine kinase and response regulator [Bacteroidota bacterium]
MKKSIILCVDDERIILTSLKSELKESLGADYLIETAEDPEDAISLMKELQDDGYEVPLVISDYIMPSLKGDELLRLIHEDYPETLKIMLTGQASAEGVANAVNFANLYRYIAKPWEREDLILTVKEALKSYIQYKELEDKRIELVKANERLMMLDKAKSYFLGLLAHELHTPLQGINGNAKFILDLAEDDDVKDCSHQILESSKRLNRLSDLSLLITQLRTDQYHLRMQKENVRNIIENAAYMLKEKADEKNIIISKNFSAEQNELKFDPALFQKVIEIILENAIKYSYSNGVIDINTSMDDKNYRIEISDNGCGFSENSLETLFDFFSSDELMHHDEGFGLGLATAKIIMDSHNCRIKARNKDTGGASVSIVYPL